MYGIPGEARSVGEQRVHLQVVDDFAQVSRGEVEAAELTEGSKIAQSGNMRPMNSP